MTDYRGDIDRIEKASSLEEIQTIARQYSAKAVGEDGILYSSKVGNTPSHAIALELAEKTRLPIIDDTPRAQFLDNKLVKLAIDDSAKRIFENQGYDTVLAKQSATDFLYGDAKAAAHSATSLDGCVWGRASKEFSGSLSGDVTLVASSANLERVFGKVELTEALQNKKINTIGGVSRTHLQDVYARSGVEAVLPEVQKRFIEAAPKGIFISPEALGKDVKQVTLSGEFATALGVGAHPFSAAAELSASGKVVRASIGMDVPVAVNEAAIAARAPVPRDSISPEIAGYRSAMASESFAASEAAERSFGATALKGAGGVAMAAGAVYELGTSREIGRASCRERV